MRLTNGTLATLKCCKRGILMSHLMMAPIAFFGTATAIPNRQSDVVRAMVRVRTWYTNFSLRYKITSVTTFSSEMIRPMAFWGFKENVPCSNGKLDSALSQVLLVTDTFVSIVFISFLDYFLPSVLKLYRYVIFLIVKEICSQTYIDIRHQFVYLTMRPITEFISVIICFVWWHISASYMKLFFYTFCLHARYLFQYAR